MLPKHKVTIISGFVNIKRLIKTGASMVKVECIEVYLFQNVKCSNHTTGRGRNASY